jgi:hypothetical protein
MFPRDAHGRILDEHDPVTLLSGERGAVQELRPNELGTKNPTIEVTTAGRGGHRHRVLAREVIGGEKTMRRVVANPDTPDSIIRGLPAQIVFEEAPDRLRVMVDPHLLEAVLALARNSMHTLVEVEHTARLLIAA